MTNLVSQFANRLCVCRYRMTDFLFMFMFCFVSFFLSLSPLFVVVAFVAVVVGQIMSMAGIPQTALHMSKVQFYSCLKLIAAHQQSVPLRQELIASTVALHLPTFNWKKSPTLNGTVNDDMTRWRSSIGESPNLIELARVETHSDVANSDITSTDSEVEHNETDKKSHAVCMLRLTIDAMACSLFFCIPYAYHRSQCSPYSKYQ